MGPQVVWNQSLPHGKWLRIQQFLLFQHCTISSFHAFSKQFGRVWRSSCWSWNHTIWRMPSKVSPSYPPRQKKSNSLNLRITPAKGKTSSSKPFFWGSMFSFRFWDALFHPFPTNNAGSGKMCPLSRWHSSKLLLRWAPYYPRLLLLKAESDLHWSRMVR